MRMAGRTAVAGSSSHLGVPTKLRAISEAPVPRPARAGRPDGLLAVPSFAPRQPNARGRPGQTAGPPPGCCAYRRGMHSSNLADRLVRVRRRIEGDVPYSPDWAAATAELEEIEAALAAERAAAVTKDLRPRTDIEATAA